MKSFLVSTVAAMSMVALCGGASAQTAATKLNVGDVAPISSAWPSFVALDKGMFRAHGLDVTVTYAGSAAAAVQQLVGGAFDISLSTFDTTLRAAGAGASISVLGAAAVKYPYSVMAASDIKSAQDLRGKTIILSFQKDITTIIWNRWLHDQGIDPKSVDQVYDGATPNRFAALSAKRVQAAFLGAPFDFRARQDGFGKLMDFGQYAKGIPFTVVVVRRDWLRDHGNIARSYLAALAEAVDWLDDKANREEAAGILAKDTKQSQDLALQTYDSYVTQQDVFSRGLKVPDGATDLVGTMLAELGDIKSRASIPDTVIDASFLPH